MAMPQISESRGSKTALAIAIVFVIFGLIGVVGSWGAYFMDTEIVRSGLRADAQLLKKVFLRVADGDSDYILEYRFTTASGQPVEASRTVSKALWHSVREGQQLSVRYSEKNPKRNFPDGQGVTSLSVVVFVSLLSALIGILGVLIVWGYFRRPNTSA